MLVKPRLCQLLYLVIRFFLLEYLPFKVVLNYFAVWGRIESSTTRERGYDCFVCGWWTEVQKTFRRPKVIHWAIQRTGYHFSSLFSDELFIRYPRCLESDWFSIDVPGMEPHWEYNNSLWREKTHIMFSEEETWLALFWTPWILQVKSSLIELGKLDHGRDQLSCPNYLNVWWRSSMPLYHLHKCLLMTWDLY